ncbi:MAG: helix-turn-helix domain-containing protein, partial [Faecalibacillus intestinalis]
MKLGARIRKIRMFRNITQKELGRRLGYGESSADVRIAQYESGQRTPKQET